jgi:hypothetical protein
MEPILRTIANVKKKSGSFKVFSHGWYLLNEDVSNPCITLRLYVDSHKPSNYYYNCLAMDLPGKDGRKEEATSQQHIQLRLQTL